MTAELIILALSVALYFVLLLFQTIIATAQYGGVKLLGNRDALNPPGRYLARTQRTANNMKEALVMFAPLVLIAAAAEISTSWTVLGAQIFLAARIAHALLYLIGVPWLRTLAWLVGVIGMAMIFAELFRF